MTKKHLIAPGPTPVPESARLAMARSLIHHRGPEFTQLFREVFEGLKWVFQTENDVLSLTCSGTGAFEAVMSNFTRRGQKVVFVSGGKFGERWGEMATALGMEAIEVPVEWGDSVDPDALRDTLREHPDTALVTVSASETSTGAWHPVEALAAVVREESSALFAVDGITAVGVHPLAMDELGIDVIVSGSQKAFSVPPGLAFVAVGPRAWERAPQSDHSRYYFDLMRERAKQRNGQTAFTPAISVFIALRVVLEEMRAEGLEGIWSRHELLAKATRAGVTGLGLNIFPKSPSNGVTALTVPAGVAAPSVVKAMRDTYGVTVAGGQDQLKPSLVRIGHMGNFDRSDVILALSALELALRDAGVDVASGQGVAAAQRVFSNHG